MASINTYILGLAKPPEDLIARVGREKVGSRLAFPRIPKAVKTHAQLVDAIATCKRALQLEPASVIHKHYLATLTGKKIMLHLFDLPTPPMNIMILRMGFDMDTCDSGCSAIERRQNDILRTAYYFHVGSRLI